MAEKVNLQQKIQQYRQANPKLKNLSDEKIVSIMVQNGVISLTKEEQRSVFGNNIPQNNNMGLQVEKTARKTNPEKTIYLQSGRKVVYSKTANGKIVMKYYGTDSTPLNPDYFKKVEGQISISADGKTYTITKDGKKTTLQAKDPSKGAIDQNLARLNNEEKRLKKTKKEQGVIGKSWDWIKNTTGIGDGSDKAQKQIEAERKLLNQIKTGKISKKDFKEATGVEYSQENLEKFKRGELSQATAKINGYKEGQEMAVDITSDIVSGVVSYGASAAFIASGIAAAPFTAGASLGAVVAGIGIGATAGAAIKVGLKAADSASGGRKYTPNNTGKDAIIGAVSGALAPFTIGLGGVVANSAGKVVPKVLAQTARYTVEGGMFGAVDGGTRAILEGEEIKDVALATVEGGIGGALVGNIFGHGGSAIGKGAQKLCESLKGNNNTASTTTYIPTILQEFKQGNKIPKKVFEQIVDNQELDVNAKVACLKYIEQRSDNCIDKLSKFIEIKKATKTINQIISNPDIDKKCISYILHSHKENIICENYKILSQYKLEPMARFTLALLDDIPANKIGKYNDFVSTILKHVDNTPENCQSIAYSILDLENKSDITELTKYIKSIDINKLEELEPSIGKYDTKQLINFLDFYRQKGIKNFTKETLTLDKPLTEFLEENPIMFAQGTHELLTAYPCTNRRVGNMPEFLNLTQEESGQIFELTEVVANKLELTKYQVVDSDYQQKLMNLYKSGLEMILNKEIVIDELGAGSYGKVYKISVENCKPFVIKFFFSDASRPDCGPLAEIPLAIFTNKHFPEHFAKFYFGKIPFKEGENGFMVSEFLTPSPEGKWPKLQDEKWKYYYGDGSGWNDLRGNIIGGKICDFGCVKIIDKSNNASSSFKLFK